MVLHFLDENIETVMDYSPKSFEGHEPLLKSPNTCRKFHEAYLSRAIYKNIFVIQANNYPYLWEFMHIFHQLQMLHVVIQNYALRNLNYGPMTLSTNENSNMTIMLTCHKALRYHKALPLGLYHLQTALPSSNGRGISWRHIPRYSGFG